VGRWLHPLAGILKINTDDSSRGNLGPSRIGGVGKDFFGFGGLLFSVHKGMQTIKLMEGLAILYAFEWAYDLGWCKVICESDSQILINLQIERKVSDVSWQVAMVVQQILQISSMMEMVSFVHILREWNRAANCLAKWASKHIDG